MITEENIIGKLRQYLIPEYMHNPMREYLFKGRPTGDFLRAMFENDLMQAFERADATNRECLWCYAAFIRNELPGRSYGPGVCPWGSVENVRAWLSPPGKLWACDVCGCTDVQETAWIYMNGGKNTGDEGPTSQIFCPNCANDGVDDGAASETATEPKPYE